MLLARTPEGLIKADIKKLLESCGFYVRAVVVGQIPGRRNPSKGLPDYICIKRGRVIWLEVKTETGPIRPEQAEFIREWTFKGGEAYIVRSVDETIKVLKGLGLADGLLNF